MASLGATLCLVVGITDGDSIKVRCAYGQTRIRQTRGNGANKGAKQGKKSRKTKVTEEQMNQLAKGTLLLAQIINKSNITVSKEVGAKWSGMRYVSAGECWLGFLSVTGKLDKELFKN